MIASYLITRAVFYNFFQWKKHHKLQYVLQLTKKLTTTASVIVIYIFHTVISFLAPSRKLDTKRNKNRTGEKISVQHFFALIVLHNNIVLTLTFYNNIVLAVSFYNNIVLTALRKNW